MHPRNTYKTPPDFTKLAEEYEELKSVTQTVRLFLLITISSFFSTIFLFYSNMCNKCVRLKNTPIACAQNQEGKVCVDFKDEQQLRTLTRCLLKKDFQLDVELPPLQLVPTLSLRLNYIHWIEDITSALRTSDEMHGFDIGCGASCIYPLLAARLNKNWRMYAAESNDESIQLARENVARNDLTDRIVLLHTEDALSDIESNKQWDLDFTMCNPPFFDENVDTSVEEQAKNRTGNRQPPNNVKTGLACELMTPGGEVTFVKKMIRQSLELHSHVKVFTTMLGHKTSVNHIMEELKAHDICNFITSEFCQGRTTRWGVAWSHMSTWILRKTPPLGVTPPKEPLVFTPDDVDDIELATNKLTQILKNLAADPEAECIVEDGEEHLRFIAFKNTWSNQRRRRREERRTQGGQSNDDDDKEPTAKRRKDNEQFVLDPNRPPLIHIEFVVRDVNVNAFKTAILIEMRYLNGTAGANGVHEILQFLRNQWQSK